MVLHFIDDLNTFLATEWQQLSSLLPQCQSAAFARLSTVDDYDRLELVLSCLLLIANTRRYWIVVDVVRNINTEEEEENASYVDLDLWMTNFIRVLQYNNEMMRSGFGAHSRIGDTPTATVLEDLKSSVIAFCSICVNRHTNLFMPYFESFSSTIWSTLGDIGAANQSLKYQDVAVASLHFFSSVATRVRSDA